MSVARSQFLICPKWNSMYIQHIITTWLQTFLLHWDISCKQEQFFLQEAKRFSGRIISIILIESIIIWIHSSYWCTRLCSKIREPKRENFINSGRAIKWRNVERKYGFLNFHFLFSSKHEANLLVEQRQRYRLYSFHLIRQIDILNM